MPLESTRRNEEKTEVSIRQMEIDDIAAVYHLGEELFTSEEFPILYRTWDPYEVTEYFTSDPDYCLVAEAEGRIIGFILATTIEKEGTAWKKYGYVGWIGVDDALQRTNLGRRLYRRLEDRLRENGVRMVIVDSEGDNEGAIGFLKALGFSPRAQHLWLAKTLRRPAKRAAKPERTVAPAAGLQESQEGKIGKRLTAPASPFFKKKGLRKPGKKPPPNTQS